MFSNSHEEYPENLRDAISRASTYTPLKEEKYNIFTSHVSDYKNSKYNYKNDNKNNNGFGIKCADGTMYYPKANQCSNPDCREFGHYVRDCPKIHNKVNNDVQKAINDERSHFGKGK